MLLRGGVARAGNVLCGLSVLEPGQDSRQGAAGDGNLLGQEVAGFLAHR